MTEHNPLASEAAFNQLIGEHPAVLIYFSAPGCGVCHVLKPRIITLLEERFPRLPYAEVDCQATPSLAAQQRVFTVPVVMLFVMGRESWRLIRSFSLAEVSEQLARPYHLLFGEEA